MPHKHIQDEQAAEPLRRELARIHRYALDCEAAGFHRYSDRLCLIQLTTPSDTWILDPLAFDTGELLRPSLEDPAVEVVMHGSDYDLRLLNRDLAIRVAGLFDTQIAAALLGEPGLGLAALLESHLDVHLSKKYQRADWAKRPLDEGMLAYAADDTRYLIRLADILRDGLVTMKREAWADEEFRLLERTATVETDGDNPEPKDPVVRVKGARDLPPRELTALREALQWRDEIARERDRAPFRVVGNQALLEVVTRSPRDSRALEEIKGFPVMLARSGGADLLKRLEHVSSLPEGALRPYPRLHNRGTGRPPPEVEATVDRLKEVRNRRAAELGLDRSALPSNAVLLAIATQGPRSEADLAAVAGMRHWQVGILGAELFDALRRAV